MAIVMSTNTKPPSTAESVVRINGVPLHRPGETLAADTLRQRACTELLRQAARAEGLLDPADAATRDGIVSVAASKAIEMLLDLHLAIPEPSEEECRRYYAAHAASLRTAERVHVRHILFALTPGMDLAALRKRAEACLLEVRCHDGKERGKSADGFARSARELSNCPSGAEGGDLGWLVRADIAPELAREIFGQMQVGVMPRLVHSRFGLHVVEVIARENGADRPFEAVRGAVAMSLRQQSFVTALRQYLRVLAGEAEVIGIDLDAADTPLVQ